MDMIIGAKSNPIAAAQLSDELRRLKLDVTLYLGYPILASIDELIDVTRVSAWAIMDFCKVV